MELNELFLQTINDIREKIQANDSYKIFMTAPLLRKLLLDGEPLIDRVNRQYKLKLKFRINNRLPLMMEGLVFWTIQDGFDPDTSHSSTPLDVNRQGMLKRQVMVKQDQVYTVHELIDYLCHIGGAVHYSSPQKEKELILKEVEQPIIRSLLAINRVVLKGIKPLEDAINNGH